MRKLITLVMLMCIAGSAGLFAQCPSGELSGTVFQDFNFDGVDNDNGVGVFGAKVYVFDASGIVDSAETASDGTFSMSGLTDGDDYRVEFYPPDASYESSFFADAKTRVQFVTAPSCDLEQGFAFAADFCRPDPLIFTPCFINGDPLAGGSADTVAIVAFPYTATGAGQAANIGVANTSDVGACWGISYQKTTNRMFATSVLRRHAGFGPGGTGAIYVYDVTTPMNAPKIHTIDLDALGFDTGTDPRIMSPLPPNLIDPSHDVEAYSLIGKMSLGDMEISDDGKYLYVVNLFDRTLLEIFIDNPFSPPTAADVNVIPMTDPGCGTNDWRPWGLDFYRGEVYAGFVCSAQGSQNVNDLHAYVRKYSPDSGTWTAVFDMGLNYPRGYTIASAPTKGPWNPWSDDYTDAFDLQNFNMNYPQPILSDIEFDIDGSMVLGFMDRLGMQGGFENYLPDVSQNGFVSTFSAGDIIRVCNVNGNFVLEGTGGACSNAMGLNNGQGPNGSEFYWDDKYENSLNMGSFETHQETSLGGLFIRPGSGELTATHYDPINFNTGGIAYFDNMTGARTHHYEVFPALPGYAGKSAGIGVLMANCDAAPVEKGNFVWIDEDEDGIQDPGESPLEGVNVSLYEVQGGQCVQLATTTTNPDGEYYFNDANVTPGLASDAEYFIVVGEGQFDQTDMTLFDTLMLTQANVGEWTNPDQNDSDGELMAGPTCFDGIPHTSTQTTVAGANHACDFGFIVMACDIMITATQVTDETCEGDVDGSIAVTATSSDPSGIQYRINGGAFQSSNVFDNLSPGNYIIRASVVADSTCFAETMVTILPGTPLPVPTLFGDSLPCPDAVVSYLVLPFDPANTYMFTVSNGATILSQFGNTLTVEFGDDATLNPIIITVKETTPDGCMGFDTIQACIRETFLICDDDLNVSVGDMCTAVVSFDMLLEGTYKTFDGFTVTITDHNGNVISNDTTISGCGDYYFTVTEPCLGNSCWGDITVEDKTGPVINCQPLSFPCTYTDTSVVLPNLAGNPTFATVGGGIGGVVITDNCGLDDVTFSDWFMPIDCDSLNGQVAAILIRTWTATDTKGNTSVCTQEITFTRPNITTTVFPSDTTLACDASSISPTVTGIPTIVGIPAWPTAGFCGITVSYTDDTIAICDGTLKILRTWLVHDDCLPLSNTGTFQNPVSHIQLVKLLDDQGPIFTCPDDITVTAIENCVAEVDLPDVLVIDNCSRIANVKALVNGQTIYGQVTDFQGNNLWHPDTMASFGYVYDLPLGTHTVIYTITDDCGNSSTCSFDIEVVDNVPPTAICDAHTQASLGADGMVLVPALTFDDGSLDNCNDVWFKVRRMQQNPCTSHNDLLFDDFAKFCCEDIGDTIMVVMRVYDRQPNDGLVNENHLNGHYDDCMVEVTVVDKIFPYINCPDDVTVDCIAFDPTLWSYGTLDAQDNCALDTIIQDALYHNYDAVCKQGVIQRRLTAVDVHGNSRRCTQNITVTRSGGFTIQFPDDQTVTECDGTGLYGEPILGGTNCGQIGKGFTDEILNLVPDACYKILRTWRVEDGCLHDVNDIPNVIYNPINDDDGVFVNSSNYYGYAFEYTQVIKVLDDEAPVIVDCEPNLTLLDFTDNNPLAWNDMTYWDPAHQSHDLCEMPADVHITATDSCSGANIDASYMLNIDADGDGIMELTLLSGQIGSPVLQKAVIGRNVRFFLDPLYNLPHGKHKIKWIVRDGCGNEAFCDQNIEIRDGKKPTVVCKNGLTAEIMQMGMLDMPLDFFLEYGSDNCTPSNLIEFAIRKQGTGNGWPSSNTINLDCNDLGTNFVEVWGRDKAGNLDFCVGYVILQDNMGACSNTFATVAGALMTEDIEGVEEAWVEINNQNGIAPIPGFTTGSDGRYNFNAVPMGDDYVIVPEKSSDWTNGVNTYDLLQIQKHLLGNSTLPTPYAIIAADANHSGSITPSDIIELRKLVLGVTEELPNNTSWRFVDEGFVFTNAQNPFADDFPETLTYGDLQQHVTTGDFVSIKVGDVNGSALANTTVIPSDRSADETLIFDVENALVKAGDEVVCRFSAEKLARIEGLQMTLKFDANALKFSTLQAGKLSDLNESNFGLQAIDKGLLAFSWNKEGGDLNASEAFVLHFIAKEDGQLSDWVELSHSLLHSEAYGTADEYMDIALRFDGKTVVGTGFEVYQNRPNPFNSKTLIGFHLPAESQARLRIFDATGRLIFQKQGDYAKGYNAIQVEGNQLPADGPLFYTVETAFGTAEKQMIKQ